MHLQKRMKSQIDALCGHQQFTAQLRKYSKLTTSKHRMRYTVTINAINELYVIDKVDTKFNTIRQKKTVIKAIKMFETDNRLFDSPVIKLLIEMMQFNLDHITDIRNIS